MVSNTIPWPASAPNRPVSRAPQTLLSAKSYNSPHKQRQAEF